MGQHGVTEHHGGQKRPVEQRQRLKTEGSADERVWDDDPIATMTIVVTIRAGLARL